MEEERGEGKREVREWEGAGPKYFGLEPALGRKLEFANFAT